MFKNGNTWKGIISIVFILVGLLITYLILPMGTRVTQNTEMILQSKEIVTKEMSSMALDINTNSVRYENILDKLEDINKKLDKL